MGTESRLLTLFDAAQADERGQRDRPAGAHAELHQRKRDEIDAEIARVLAGDMPLLDDTALKDRFQQFTALARELLTDFREVEHNFRGLDRRVRERIALWDGAKGALLEEIMGERDAIADSDQGRSFRAFWDFLMSSRRQEELTAATRTRADAARRWPRSSPTHAPGECTTTGWRPANTPSARWPSCRSSCGAFWTTRPGWRTAASWTSCTASRPRRWQCATQPPAGEVMQHRRHHRRHRVADGAAAPHAGDQTGDRRYRHWSRRSGHRCGSAVLADRDRQGAIDAAYPPRLAGSARRSPCANCARRSRCNTAWPNWWPICSSPATPSGRWWMKSGRDHRWRRWPRRGEP